MFPLKYHRNAPPCCILVFVKVEWPEVSYFWRKKDFSIHSDKSLEAIAEDSINLDFV